MILLDVLPEATYMNYLMLNMAKIPLFQYLIVGFKSAAVIFVIGDLIMKYYKITGLKNPFTAKDFIRPIVLVCIISTYDIAMSVADFAVTEIDMYVANTIGTKDKFVSTVPLIDPSKVNNPTYTPPDPLPAQKTPVDVEASTLEKISEATTYLMHPSKMIITVFEFVGDFFSSMIYTSALMIRVFGLFFLKVLGPLFIIISMFGKFKNAMWEWLRYYIIFSVWIIPFYLVNIFFNFVHAQSRTMAEYCGWDSAMTAVSISLIAVFVKFTVTKGSFSWLEKIIKINGE